MTLSGLMLLLPMVDIVVAAKTDLVIIRSFDLIECVLLFGELAINNSLGKQLWRAL